MSESDIKQHFHKNMQVGSNERKKLFLLHAQKCKNGEQMQKCKKWSIIRNISAIVLLSNKDEMVFLSCLVKKKIFYIEIHLITHFLLVKT